MFSLTGKKEATLRLQVLGTRYKNNFPSIPVISSCVHGWIFKVVMFTSFRHLILKFGCKHILCYEKNKRSEGCPKKVRFTVLLTFASSFIKKSIYRFHKEP